MSGLFRRRRTAADGTTSTDDGGPPSEAFETFLAALRETSPDFQRLCRVAGDAAGMAAMPAVYATLPQTGKVSRVAVMRRYLLKLAEAAGDEADVETIGRLSERQIQQVARHRGKPI